MDWTRKVNPVTFIEAIKDSDWIDAAKLLLPNVNISQINDFDLSQLACCCAYDLFKLVLKRRDLGSYLELDPMFATDFVPRIDPEDFFVVDDGLPLTGDFMRRRLHFCRNLAHAAAIYVKHDGNDKEKKKIKINIWMTRCLEIKTAFDVAASKA